jgi:mRNA interferase MazF
MHRGEIWTINLEPTDGAEIKKTRPVVIVSSDAVGILPLRVVVTLTEWKDRYLNSHWIVPIGPSKKNGLSKKSAVDTFQIRSVSTARFINKSGEVEQPDLDAIVQAIGLVIEYPIP